MRFHIHRTQLQQTLAVTAVIALAAATPTSAAQSPATCLALRAHTESGVLAGTGVSSANAGTLLARPIRLGR